MSNLAGLTQALMQGNQQSQMARLAAMQQPQMPQIGGGWEGAQLGAQLAQRKQIAQMQQQAAGQRQMQQMLMQAAQQQGQMRQRAMIEKTRQAEAAQRFAMQQEGMALRRAAGEQAETAAADTRAYRGRQEGRADAATVREEGRYGDTLAYRDKTTTREEDRYGDTLAHEQLMEQLALEAANRANLAGERDQEAHETTMKRVESGADLTGPAALKAKSKTELIPLAFGDLGLASPDAPYEELGPLEKKVVDEYILNIDENVSRKGGVSTSTYEGMIAPWLSAAQNYVRGVTAEGGAAEQGYDPTSAASLRKVVELLEKIAPHANDKALRTGEQLKIPDAVWSMAPSPAIAEEYLRIVYGQDPGDVEIFVKDEAERKLLFDLRRLSKVPEGQQPLGLTGPTMQAWRRQQVLQRARDERMEADRKKLPFSGTRRY